MLERRILSSTLVLYRVVAPWTCPFEFFTDVQFSGLPSLLKIPEFLVRVQPSSYVQLFLVAIGHISVLANRYVRKGLYVTWTALSVGLSLVGIMSKSRILRRSSQNRLNAEDICVTLYYEELRTIKRGVLLDDEATVNVQADVEVLNGFRDRYNLLFTKRYMPKKS